MRPSMILTTAKLAAELPDLSAVLSPAEQPAVLLLDDLFDGAPATATGAAPPTDVSIAPATATGAAPPTDVSIAGAPPTAGPAPRAIRPATAAAWAFDAACLPIESLRRLLNAGHDASSPPPPSTSTPRPVRMSFAEAVAVRTADAHAAYKPMDAGSGGGPPRAEGSAARDSEAAFCVLTSGTTSVSKLVVLPEAALTHSTLYFQTHLQQVRARPHPVPCLPYPHPLPPPPAPPPTTTLLSHLHPPLTRASTTHAALTLRPLPPRPHAPAGDRAIRSGSSPRGSTTTCCHRYSVAAPPSSCATTPSLTPRPYCESSTPTSSMASVRTPPVPPRSPMMATRRLHKHTHPHPHLHPRPHAPPNAIRPSESVRCAPPPRCAAVARRPDALSTRGLTQCRRAGDLEPPHAQPPRHLAHGRASHLAHALRRRHPRAAHHRSLSVLSQRDRRHRRVRWLVGRRVPDARRRAH